MWTWAEGFLGYKVGWRVKVYDDSMIHQRLQGCFSHSAYVGLSLFCVCVYVGVCVFGKLSVSYANLAVSFVPTGVTAEIIPAEDCRIPLKEW